MGLSVSVFLMRTTRPASSFNSRDPKKRCRSRSASRLPSGYVSDSFFVGCSILDLPFQSTLLPSLKVERFFLGLSPFEMAERAPWIEFQMKAPVIKTSRTHWIPIGAPAGSVEDLS